MSHIPGHVQSSKGPFRKQVGLLYPHKIVKGKWEPTGFPVLFVNNLNQKLKHGQRIGFHPLPITCEGKPTLIIAINVASFEDHEKVDSILEGKTKMVDRGAKAENLKLLMKHTTSFVNSPQYEQIYSKKIAPGKNLQLAKSKRKVEKPKNAVVQWLVNESLPFSRMNLRKGP